ncbi:MAG: YkgJ family cysteine cluster protein [Cyclobacteriaceae bacterium]|nr:YkgJ family cysteine cluster protein [Cyclobacteriaceae bacterium]
MSIAKKVSDIEALFGELDSEINSFQSTTKLKCLSNCGRCCTHNQVDASPLEFLPWAYQLYINGEAFEMLEALAEKTSKICHNYNPIGLLEEGKGNCSTYEYRGLICRLFGYGANTDKYGKLRLATCKIIKEDQALAFQNAENMVADGLPIPVFTHYYMRLSQVDYQLGNTIVPINTALKIAIEEVLQYYMYRNLEDDVRGAA